MKKVSVFIIMILVNILPAIAEEKTESQGPSTLAMFGILEGAMVMNSYIASRGPGGFGITMLVLEPFFLTPKASVESWVAYGVVASIPLYNLSISDDFDSGNISSKDVFTRNMIAFNLLAGVAYFLLANEKSKSEEASFVSLGVTPLTDGLQLSMRYEF